MVVLAASQIGAKALYLFLLWLASAYAGSYLSERKGYGIRPGLAAGLLLSALGAVAWLLVPARDGSLWKRDGALPRRTSVRRAATSRRAP